MIALWFFLLTISRGHSLPGYQDSPQWHSGKKLEHAARRSPIFVNWQQVPLKPQLQAISRNLQIAVLLDRRVDPNQLVDRQDRDVSFEQFLWALGADEKLGVCRVGDLYYLGPEETALALPAEVNSLDEQLADSNPSATLKKKLNEKIQLQVDHPFDPKKWLVEEAANAELKLLNPEELPMDWWGPIDWPAMPRFQAYALVAAGFELGLQVEEAGIRFVRLKLPDELERSYTLLESQSYSLEELRKKHPKLQLDLRKDKLTASGPAAEFGQLERQLGAKSDSNPTAVGERRFTLNKTKAPRGSILATIAQQMGLKLKFAEEARTTLDERIEVDVQQVTLDELLEKVLAGTDLSHAIEAGELRIQDK